MKAMLAVAFAALGATSACSLYNSSGHGDDTQPDAGCAVAKVLELDLIDPSTNQCVAYPVSGYEDCQPCYDQGPDGSGGCEPFPGWPQCDSACTGLAEQACLSATGCHATYDTNGAETKFWTCDAAGPYEGFTGACATLDATGCSTRDDCTTTYTGATTSASFTSCAPETAPAACESLTDEAACTARSDCEAVYTGMNCTCDEHGCTCQTETFAYCETPGRL